ncbi:ECF-type sigma factor [Dokdonella sp. MW10]|uniref:ECF-type sigma factor n=1 Tax=Dokdonella sp. MW10 TaxID=2992926 RepID=UPI003F81B1D1
MAHATRARARDGTARVAPRVVEACVAHVDGDVVDARGKLISLCPPVPPGGQVLETPEEITRLLDQARDGERDAWSRLLRRTYGDIKRLARRQLAQGATMPTLNTTGLVNEWYLRMADAGDAVPQDRRHFFALTAKIMRQVICAYARERATSKRGGAHTRMDLEVVDRELGEEANRFLALDQALERLAGENEAMVRVVECRFFAGMTEPETAEAVDIPLRTVQWLWAQARDRLAHTLEAP